jgi:hypothetical protein
MRLIMKKIISILIIALSLNSCNLFRKEILRRESIPTPLTVDFRSPQMPAGQIEAQFNRAFPLTGIIKREINVSYYPYEDAVCLQFRLNTLTYHMFWHKAGREAFVKALAKYNDDFSAQKLTNRNNRTKNQYGTVENNYLIWYMSSFTTRANGNMNTELGYYFREDSPFFAITLLEAYYKSRTLEKSDDQTSPVIPVFFTRSQAEELAAFFDESYLRSLAPNIQPAQRINPDADFEQY